MDGSTFGPSSGCGQPPCRRLDHGILSSHLRGPGRQNHRPPPTINEANPLEADLGEADLGEANLGEAGLGEANQPP